MKERLQKILSRHGIASRRAAEKMIADGRVEVNGLTAEVGQSADEDADIITVDGEALRAPPEAVYIALYKPRGYVTTMRDEKGRKTVWDLVSDCGTRVYPVGRLDLDSEGLLLMTNDGDLAMRLAHPSGEVPKTYRVTVKGAELSAVDRLAALDELDGEPMDRPEVEIRARMPDRMKLSVTIREGKNRQIRRMCEAAGLEVLRLKRLSVGELRLRRLGPGEWRYLDKDELRYLKSVKRRPSRG